MKMIEAWNQKTKKRKKVNNNSWKNTPCPEEMTHRTGNTVGHIFGYGTKNETKTETIKRKQKKQVQISVKLIQGVPNIYER